MATVTWKGEPGVGGDEGPKSVTWGGKVLKKGEGVEITDPAIIEKAKNNPYFEVTGADESSAGTTVPAPSQTGAQYPVPKPGEPVKAPTPGPMGRPVPKV
jgi:hypothetical protein